MAFKKYKIPKTKKEVQDFLLSNTIKIPQTGCLDFFGKSNRKNYPYIHKAKEPIRLSRLIYSILFGEIPEKICVCHTCDNRKCVNPEHLILGTKSWNMWDKCRKGRQSKGGVHNTVKCGEKNPKAKINSAQALEIRALYDSGTCSLKEIGGKFGITKQMVRYIGKRMSWRHI